MRISLRLLPLLLFLAPFSAFSATLTTLAANNGTGGIFFNLTAIQSLTVTSFDTYFGGTSGTQGLVEVYTRPGSYVGFQAASTGWTLSETITATSNGTNSLANILLGNPLNIAGGETLGIYLHGITSGNAIRYQGTGSSATTDFSNADLALFSGDARTGGIAFAGTQFTPRAFAGNVNYELTSSSVPEPGTMTLLSIGLLSSLAWRKRSATKR